MRLAHHPAGDLVMLNVNHAAFDAFGGLRLLRSTARAYAGIQDPLPDIELAAARQIRSQLATDELRTRAQPLAGAGDKLADPTRPPPPIPPEHGSDRPRYGRPHSSP